MGRHPETARLIAETWARYKWPMHERARTPAELAAIRARYDGGETTEQVAAFLGVSTSRARDVLLQGGTVFRGNGRAQKLVETAALVERVAAAYLAGKSQKQIGKAERICKPRVRGCLQRAGIAIRSPKEASILAARSRKQPRPRPEKRKKARAVQDQVAAPKPAPVVRILPRAVKPAPVAKPAPMLAAPKIAPVATPVIVSTAADDLALSGIDRDDARFLASRGFTSAQIERRLNIGPVRLARYLEGVAHA